MLMVATPGGLASFFAETSIQAADVADIPQFSRQ